MSKPNQPSAHTRKVLNGQTASYRVLDSVSNELSDTQLEVFKTRLKHALDTYPELIGITVTVAKADPDDNRYYAKADWINNIIFVPTHEVAPYMTICHELSHLAIKNLKERGVDVPITSEEFCSIFAVARMNPENIDTTRIAYLGHPSKPPEKWPEICSRALAYRKNNRNYIQQCKEWLAV